MYPVNPLSQFSFFSICYLASICPHVNRSCWHFRLLGTNLIHTLYPSFHKMFNYLPSPRVSERVSEVAQSCPTLCDPMYCSLPGSSLHGILQARVLEWVAIFFSRVSSRPRDRTQVSSIPGRCFNLWATREAHMPGTDGNSCHSTMYRRQGQCFQSVLHLLQ